MEQIESQQQQQQEPENEETIIRWYSGPIRTSKPGEIHVRPGSGPDRAEPLDSQPRQISEYRLCKLCKLYVCCAAFVPCGHIIACSRCFPYLTWCPHCKDEIKRGIKLFFR